MQGIHVIGSVGEPIDPDAWSWYYHIVGQGHCSLVDTFWQTETGGHMLTPLPGCTPMKPGAATRPFFGVKPALLSDDNEPVCDHGFHLLFFLARFYNRMPY
ncbi:unnamed protein product [Protopolystoma xenopodis]|uniref:acetate--CoA ligase n=1 Tax=Protopolystoma xenopodis TaxID=117903 RepID=A0A448WHT9_9PLAT|nr:unnamed protein product [Protopolystoma xenopodis]